MYMSGRIRAGLAAVLCFFILSVDALSLLQGTSFFWSGERRVTNSSNPYSTVVYAHSDGVVPASAFGGCTGSYCPISQVFTVQRLCFSSQSSTVTIRTTLGTKSEHFDSELYVFRVEGDVPPIRGSDAPIAYEPSYSAFWASPKTVFSIIDENYGSICSPDGALNNDACKNKAPLNGVCSREPTGAIRQCPEGTTLRKLSRVEFPIYHEYGRPFQCYYAAVGAKDGPNATELTFGLKIDLSPPGPVAAGSSPDNPRQGPFDLRDLGIGALPFGAAVEPFVEPAWLNLTDAVASGCISASCKRDPDFAEESAAPMFVYNNLCFTRTTEANQTAQIKTSYGGAGPSDTTLFVYDDARTVSEWNDAGNPVCSDGSVPDKANCGPDKVCKNPQDQCPTGTEFRQLSRVDVPIAKGVGEFCLNAAVGIQLGAGSVIQIGVDAAVLGENGLPSQTVSITSDAQPNGTTITTTETTFANGTMTTDVVVVEPPPAVPAQTAQGTLGAIAGGDADSSGGGAADSPGGEDSVGDDVAGSDGERRTTKLGRGLGGWIKRMVNRTNQ